MMTYQHWHISTDENHVIWLAFNRHGASVNTINTVVLDELNQILQGIEKQVDATGLVIYSTKPKGFIAGADVHAFSVKTKDEILDFLRQGQAVFARLEALPIPTVAMIDGFCMGGGLELALACRYRIATDSDHTKLGLPEIRLGIHPGWGGTVRLPRLIGGFQALSNLILTGKSYSAYQAKKMGFVDEVVPLRQLKRAAAMWIANPPAKHRPTWVQSLTNHTWLRACLAPLIRNQLSKKVNKAHYPAPFAVVNLWEKEGVLGERAYAKEIDSLEALMASNDTAKNLIRIFLLRERLKAFAKNSDFHATHVHVVGAGVMGGDIAAWCALKGLRVTLQDKSFPQVAKAVGRASTLFKKHFKKETRLAQAAMDRLIPDPDGYGAAKADVIIEAVFENLAIKKNLMKEIEQHARKDAILASNTSSIPLEEISQAMKHPERLVGIHYFNPVALMELVEIVSSTKTSSAIQAQACAFVNQIGRLPLPVKSNPGFLVNRVLMPYMLECVRLLEEGYSPETIDAAAENFGMMMGPVELVDAVGMDVCLAVAENLVSHYGDNVPQTLREKVKMGQLGRKTGEGFYVYKQGKPVKKKVTDETKFQEIADRLVTRLVDESEKCLQEGVVADADLLDAGMIFGTGFAPFRGGPMAYVNTPKPVEIVEKKETQETPVETIQD